MSIEIPKVIHYCWFGKAPLPKSALYCIESWKRYLPDYEIKRWDENNFDLSINDYVKEAYTARKWAFVSDYVRIWVLFHYGGIYFDTDVEVIRPMDDLISAGAFMGCERDGRYTSNELAVTAERIVSNSERIEGYLMRVNPGLGLSCQPKLKFYQELLNIYSAIHFVNVDKSLNLTTIVEYVTDLLKSHGLKDIKGVQTVEGITIYPQEYFNPKSYDSGKTLITPNTRSIHHYSMSWFSKKTLFAYKIRKFLINILGISITDKIINRIRYR